MKEEEVPVATPQLKTRPDQVNNDDSSSPPPAIEDSIEPVNTESDLDLSETTPADELNTDVVVDTPNDFPDESPIIDESTPPADSSIVSDDSSPVESDSTPTDTPISSEDSTLTESVPSSDEFGQGQSQSGNDPFGDLASPIEDGDGDLTEKILQDLESQTKTAADETPTEYVAPPDYEYPGRGLVYNCKAQHWACVDGPSYKICEQNASFQKTKEANPECYPFNIYETSKGCTNMQNRVVSAGSNTDFCNGF